MDSNGPGADLAAQPLTVDGLELRVAPLGGFALDDFLVLVKPMEAVDAYRELLGQFTEPCMVELGIAYGGSVAFHALLARPELLVALELRSERLELLDKVLAERDLTDRVHLHYGVDQADVPRVRHIVTSALAGRLLDLVIDDASHFYAPTVTSFETLFPYLRPGGQYIIEDWACDDAIRALLEQALEDPDSPQHGWARQAADGALVSGHEGQQSQADVALESLGLRPPGARPSGPPLSRLAAELALAPANPSSGIASVTTNKTWIAVERSDAVLDPSSFRLAPDVLDPFGTLSR